MDSDPSLIPVAPIPFEHGLAHFAQTLAAGQAKIVAIGSSTTAGEGNIPAYPGRLLSFVQSAYLNANLAMINKGISGQEAPIELLRFGTDVIPENPDLVNWQVGTNAVWQPPDQHPPSFDETTAAIRDGLVKLRKETSADVILMDLQYVPAVLTSDKIDATTRMLSLIEQAAATAKANLFRRFAMMRKWHEIEKFSFDTMVDPTDPTRLHQSDYSTQRVAFELGETIAAAARIV